MDAILTQNLVHGVDDDCGLLRVDFMLETLALAGAPLRGGAVGVGDDLANAPRLLVAPGAAVGLLIVGGPHEVLAIHRGAGVDESVHLIIGRSGECLCFHGDQVLRAVRGS